MDMQLREKWVVLRLNYQNLYPCLYQIAGKYLSGELDKFNAIVHTFLSYLLQNDTPKSREELNKQLMLEHEKNCKGFQNRQSNVFQLNALKIFITCMNSTERTPVMSPTLEDTPEIVNTIFSEVFLKGLTLESVSKLHNMDIHSVSDYYRIALHQNCILLHGVANTKKN